MSVQELYDQTIKHLPAAVRLRLAATILNDIPSQAVVDFSEEWSDEDLHDFTKANWTHAFAHLDEDENG